MLPLRVGRHGHDERCLASLSAVWGSPVPVPVMPKATGREVSTLIERCSYPPCRAPSTATITNVRTRQVYPICRNEAHGWWIHLATGVAAERVA